MKVIAFVFSFGLALTGLLQSAPAVVTLAFDEGGRTFPQVVGQQVIFSGTCSQENAAVTLTGSINAKAMVKQGRWATAPMPLDALAKGQVRIAATVPGPLGAPPVTAALRLDVLNLLHEGAKGDGKTDDQDAIKSMLQKAKTLENAVLYAPAGHVFAHSDVVDLDGVELLGGGETTTFFATNPLKSTLSLKGDGARLRNLALETTLGDTKRQSTPATTMASVFKGTNFWIDWVIVKNGASAGIFNYGGAGTAEAPARITNCQVSGTLADGIHNTNGAHFIRVEGNTLTKTGDDLIAVVSYGDKEESLCGDIVITHNAVKENTWARGITVVGGVRVSIVDNAVDSAKAAGIYICSESSYKTNRVEDILVKGNRITNCPAELPSQAPIFIQGREGFPVSRVRVEANVINDTSQNAIILGNYVTGTVIVGNQIKSAKGGVLLRGGTDTLITGNRIEGTLSMAIHIEKGALGFCQITDNEFTAINTSGQPHIAVIDLEPGAAPGAIQVTGNKHHAGRFKVEKIVECPDPKAVVRGNN